MVKSVEEKPAWLTGSVRKWAPETTRVVMQLVGEALRKGYCSANDVTDRDIPNSKLIGVAFATLPRFGIVRTETRLKSRFPSQNGRRVYVWVLQDGALARRCLRKIKSLLLDEPEPEEKQPYML